MTGWLFVGPYLALTLISPVLAVMHRRKFA